MNVNNEQYNQIRCQLNFKRGLRKSSLILLMDCMLLVFSAYAIQGSPIVYVLSQLALAVVFLHGFLLLHDCGHNTLSQKSWVNSVIGHICSIFCCMPFYPWKLIHDEHHKWAGHIDKDPVFSLLKDAKIKRKLPKIIHFGWHSFLPINVFFLHLVYWSYPLKLLKLKQMTSLRLKLCTFSVSFLLLSYILIAWFLPVSLLKIVPAIFIYGVLWETLSTPQHLGLEPTRHRPQLKDHAATTRSTYFPHLLQKYLFLNFGYHVEHHFFPALPWHELGHAHGLVKSALDDQYQMVTGVKWNISMRQKNIEDAIGVHRE